MNARSSSLAGIFVCQGFLENHSTDVKVVVSKCVSFTHCSSSIYQNILIQLFLKGSIV